MTEIQYILSDLDGVIRHFPDEHHRSVERVFSLPEDVLPRLAFQRHHLEPVVTGKISDEEWRARVAADLLREAPGCRAEQAVQRWSEFPGRVDQQVLQLLSSRRPTVELGLLTNATSRLDRDLKTLGIDIYFDHVFNTSALGVAKPDPEAFRLVIDALQRDPARILFLDDRAENVRVAASLGMKAHLFRNALELRAIL